MIDAIHFNYAPLVAIVFLFLFISTNNVFKASIKRWFLISIVLLLFDILICNALTILVEAEAGIKLCTFIKAVDMSVRPFIILAMIMIVQRGRRNKLILLSFGVVNAGIMFASLFSSKVFSYSASYKYSCGPLGHFTYALCVIYLAWFLVATVFYYQERNCMEALVIFLIVGFLIMATVMEALLNIEGLLHITVAISITFFYLYFHTQSYKRDTLTGVLNRRSFFLDVQKSRNRIKAIIAIDLNSLKSLNDEKGHAEGDRAIRVMVNCVRKSLLDGCILYRTGGDEFVIICQGQKMDALRNMMREIDGRMNDTPYSLAMGIAEYNHSLSIDSNLSAADSMMYKDKRIKKAQIAYRNVS